MINVECKLIKEYEFPVVGKISLRYADSYVEEQMWGKYFGVDKKKKVVITDCDNRGEFQEKMLNYVKEKQIEYQNEANELEELALRIKENGLEKTSQYYQYLQSKTEEVGK